MRDSVDTVCLGLISICRSFLVFYGLFLRLCDVVFWIFSCVLLFLRSSHFLLFLFDLIWITAGLLSAFCGYSPPLWRWGMFVCAHGCLCQFLVISLSHVDFSVPCAYSLVCVFGILLGDSFIRLPFPYKALKYGSKKWSDRSTLWTGLGADTASFRFEQNWVAPFVFWLW